MILFKKPIASALIICLIGLLAGPILLYPKKTQALCPVTVTTDVTEQAHMGLQSAWEGLKSAFRTGSLAKQTITASKLVWDSAKKLATWGKNVLLNMLLHQLLSMLTNDIVSWIQNGGNPRFLSMGLDDYLLKAADIAGVNFIDQYLGVGWLCDPFDNYIRNAIFKNAALDLQTFDEKARCSFDDIGHNIRDFYEDFTKGGWEAWMALTEPSGNPYGAYLIAQDEYNRVTTKAENEAEKDAMMGEGFLSPKDCIWYDAAGVKVEEQLDVIGYPPLPEACKSDSSNPGYTIGGFKAPCEKTCQIKTPSSVVNATVKKATTNFYDQLNAQISAATAGAGPFQVYVTAIANALVNRIIQEGLSAIGDGETPSYGDVGAAAVIPDVENPESNIQARDNAFEIKEQLVLLKKNIENDLLDEQEINLAILEQFPDAYLANIPPLEEVIDECEDTRYDEYAIWARNEIDEISSSTVPELNQRISDIETIKIPKILDWINDIDTAIDLALDYMTKADNWSAIYEEVGGEEESPELETAELDMRAAETALIINVQAIVQKINGAVASADLVGLNQEIQDASAVVIDMIHNLSTERGIAEWPEAGTLYAELEAIPETGITAEARSAECRRTIIGL